MKDKIKKFYEEKQDEFVRIGYYTAGAVTATLAVIYAHKLRDIGMSLAIDNALEATGEYTYILRDGTKYVLTAVKE